jgi:hypothetical protein
MSLENYHLIIPSTAEFFGWKHCWSILPSKDFFHHCTGLHSIVVGSQIPQAAVGISALHTARSLFSGIWCCTYCRSINLQSMNVQRQPIGLASGPIGNVACNGFLGLAFQDCLAYKGRLTPHKNGKVTRISPRGRLPRSTAVLAHKDIDRFEYSL